MSLRLRLLGAVAYILLLIIVALEVPLALNLARRVDAEVKNDAASQAFIVAAGASGSMQDGENLQQLAQKAGADLGARVIIVNRQAALKADSAGPALLNTSYASRQEIKSALSGLRAQGERHSDELGADILYTAVPVVNRGRTVGAVRVTQSVEEVNNRVRRSVFTLVGIGVFALLLGLALTWLLAETLSRPLRKLAATARRVEAGDLSARAEVKGATEHQEVAHAFNDMTERLGLVLDAQREFVANASHQLRTPLTGLRLRLESAAMKADPQLEAELNAAEREVDRLARLLTALLTLAREGQAPTPDRAVSLDEASAGAHARWSDRAEQEGGRIALEGPQENVTACASDDDVAIMLDNLIENALNYSPRGTTVSVRWGRTGSEVWLAVEDEGPGIAAGEEVTLFDRFARGSAGKTSPGTGLGLAVVQTLARRWRGRASIRNRPEGGARVEVWLPAVEEDDLPKAKPRLDEALTSGA